MGPVFNTKDVEVTLTQSTNREIHDAHVGNKILRSSSTLDSSILKRPNTNTEVNINHV